MQLFYHHLDVTAVALSRNAEDFQSTFTTFALHTVDCMRSRVDIFPPRAQVKSFCSHLGSDPFVAISSSFARPRFPFLLCQPFSLFAFRLASVSMIRPHSPFAFRASRCVSVAQPTSVAPPSPTPPPHPTRPLPAHSHVSAACPVIHPDCVVPLSLSLFLQCRVL